MAKAKAPPTPQSAAPPSGMRGITTIEGDVFGRISDSTIINRSNLRMESSFLTTDLSEIFEILEREGNTETLEIFTTFATELGRKEARKAVVQVLWRALVEASPGVKEAMPRFHDLNQLLA